MERYNSAVFQSLVSFSYTVAVVKDSFLNDNTWTLTVAESNRKDDPGWDESRVNPDWDYAAIITDMQRAAAAGEYLRKNLSECFQTYNDYFAPQGNVLVYIRNESLQATSTQSLLLYVGIVPRSDDWAKNMWAVENGTARFILQPPAGPVTKWFIGKPHYEVEHCLVQQPPHSSNLCRFEYSPWIMWIVCCFNFIKAAVMICVWVLRRWQDKAREDSQKEVLYTLGDAISSFMRNPERKTQDVCLATKGEFLSRRRWKDRMVKSRPKIDDEPRPWNRDQQRWAQAVGWGLWVPFITL